MDDKHLRFLRDQIVASKKLATTTDSRKEHVASICKAVELTKELQNACPHDYVIVRSSQSFDYEENCTISARYQCVFCGLWEEGRDAGVDTRTYTWNCGTLKTLTKEPFARFERGKGYRKIGELGVQGAWSKGEPLEHDLGELLLWIEKVGYGQYTAAMQKAYNEERVAKEDEERYQKFKAQYYERLKNENWN